MSIDDRDRPLPGRLLEAAARLIEQRGYEGTTVGMIAAEAGVSRRTFYRHFSSKDALLTASGEQVIEHALARIVGQPAVDELVRLLGRSVDLALADRENRLLLRLLQEQPPLAERASVWREQWAAKLAAGLAAQGGGTWPNLAQRARSSAAVHALAVAIEEWATVPGLDLARLTDEVAESLATGAGDDAAT